MIQQESRLAVADNSGAKEVLCIRVLGGSGRRYARIGDKIVVSVKSAIPGGSVKKGDVSTAVVVRTRKEYRRKDGREIGFERKLPVLSSHNHDRRGRGISAPLARELRERAHIRAVPL